MGSAGEKPEVVPKNRCFFLWNFCKTTSSSGRRLDLSQGGGVATSSLQKISMAVVGIAGWCWGISNQTSKLRACKYSFQLFFPCLLE